MLRLLLSSAFVLVIVSGEASFAEDGGSNVYQRRAYDSHGKRHDPKWDNGDDRRHHHYPRRHRFPNRVQRDQTSFSFQRPYPYHLDYYRMKYGGSYAPYFGNLYGPPRVFAPIYGNSGGPFGNQPPYGPLPYGAGVAPYAQPAPVYEGEPPVYLPHATAPRANASERLPAGEVQPVETAE